MSEEYDEYGDLIENDYDREEDENDEIRRQIMEAETNEVWLEDPADDDVDETDNVEARNELKKILPFFGHGPVINPEVKEKKDDDEA